MSRQGFSLDPNDYRTGPKCQRPAGYRFTWPGKDESVACENHAQMLANVAGIMGFHLQMIPLEDEHGLTCKQFA